MSYLSLNCCLFPGQGAQHAGMGNELFALFPEFTERANELLGYDLPALCRDNPQNRLQQTEYTQPALYVVNVLHYERFRQQYGAPGIVLGHSLGEICALYAAGAFEFETGLQIVRARGAIMSAIQNGGMAAVIGLQLSEVADMINSHFPEIDMANINTPQQIVVSGPADLIEAAAPFFEEAFATYIPLPVSGAFHSRYMAPARNDFAQKMSKFAFNTLQIPVVSNVTARPYEPAQLPGLLIEQLVRPVRWLESMEYVLNQAEFLFFECGPGSALLNMVGRIRDQKDRANSVPALKVKKTLAK